MQIQIGSQRFPIKGLHKAVLFESPNFHCWVGPMLVRAAQLFDEIPMRSIGLQMALSSTVAKHPLFFATLRSISSSSSPPPSDQNLISAAVLILKHQRSKSRWSYLRSLLTTTTGDSGLTPSQFSQITLQLRNAPHLALRFFYFTVHHSLCSHSLFSYATIIHILSRSRLKPEAQKIIHFAIRKFQVPNSSSPPPIFETLTKTYRACDSAPFVFDLLILACIESKRVDQSLQIVRMLRSKNIFPRISTCSALIELVSKSQGCFAAYDLYKEIFGLDRENEIGKDNRVRGVAPNSNVFNVIMVGFHRDGLVEMVEEVWREMVTVNCQPNEYSYSILMASYCEDRRMEEAMRVWKEMGDKGMKHDVVAYNTVIGGFCGIGEVQRAEEFFREMVLSGVESTCITFEHLIIGYCNIGDVDSAILLFKDMCRKDFRPDSSTINSIIEVLHNKSRVSEASEILKTAIKKYNIFLKQKSYVFLIEGFCQEGNMEEALKLQAEMVGKGYQPDERIYDAFIGGYVKTGNEEMAQRLSKEMLRAQIPHGRSR